MLLPPPLVFTIALTGLIVSGRILIKTLSNLATSFGVSKFAVAFVLLSIATSLPELSVAISAARQGAGEMILAVVFGSNLINSTLILGLAAFLSLGISTVELSFRRDLILGTAIAILPLILIVDGAIHPGEGIVLLGMFVYYVWLMYHSQVSNNSSFRLPHLTRGLANLAATVVCITILMVSADKTVSSALDIALALHIPPFIISIFLIAFGTSLPELVTAIHAARARLPGMALGNIIGSNITNSSLILGIASLITPVRVIHTPALVTTIIFVACSALLITILAATRGRISTREGALLMSLFVLFGIIILFSDLPAV